MAADKNGKLQPAQPQEDALQMRSIPNAFPRWRKLGKQRVGGVSAELDAVALGVAREQAAVGEAF